MSINSMLRTSNSGLLASQAALRTISDNIANVNTPGYVRKAVQQSQQVVGGVGAGVRIDGVKRVTDQYLQLASLTAGSEQSRWSAVSDYLDRAQNLFGDPAGDSYFFSRLDTIYSSFATAANDPSSSLARSQAIANMEDFFSEADRVNTQITELAKTTDSKVAGDVARANDLLSQIQKLNLDIGRAKLSGADVTGSENVQSALVDELSTLMNVRVSARDYGGVNIRSQEGLELAGDGAATLTYERTDSTRGYISVTSAGSGLTRPMTVTSGEIRGLLELRDDRLPALSDQLGEFVSRAVEQLNAAHNDSAAYPPPTSLTGRNTGLDLPAAVTGFTGVSTIAVLSADGNTQRTVAIDFTASTMSVNGAAGTAFTPANFLASLNTALGASGSASFANGALTINAAGATAAGPNGLAIDEGTSAKAGRGFSHFLGLNDLVTSSVITSYETGLTATSAHGFTAGGQIDLRIADASGKPLRDISVTVGGATMTDLLTSLNSSTTGVGLYGQFVLDASGGMTFQGSGTPPANLSIMQDNTQRGPGGPSISELFGLGSKVRTARAGMFQVKAGIVGQPMTMGLAKLDLTTTGGVAALRPGDGQGAQALADAGDVATQFQAAGGLGAVSMTIARYAMEFGGSIGRDAASADDRKSSAGAVALEANARRQSVESVNLDEELVSLTTYQQAFNASARMIQAARDMYDVLLGMI